MVVLLPALLMCVLLVMIDWRAAQREKRGYRAGWEFDFDD